MGCKKEEFKNEKCEKREKHEKREEKHCSCKKDKKKHFEYDYEQYYVKKCHCRCSYEPYYPERKKECKDKKKKSAY